MISELPEVEPLPPLPPLPPNSAALAAIPAQDGVHVLFRLMFDVSDLSEDGQKLFVHHMTDALTKFHASIKEMTRIETAAALGKIERIKAMKKNGQPQSKL